MGNDKQKGHFVMPPMGNFHAGERARPRRIARFCLFCDPRMTENSPIGPSFARQG